VPKHDGIRNKQFKLIHYYEIDVWEMFDLENDPNEMNNVFEDGEYAKIRLNMEKKYYDIREEYKVED